MAQARVVAAVAQRAGAHSRSLGKAVLLGKQWCQRPAPRACGVHVQLLMPLLASPPVTPCHLAQVLLTKDSELGKAGQLKTVPVGYWRNFLKPQGLAVFASEGILEKIRAAKEAEERQRQEVKAKAQAMVRAGHATRATGCARALLRHVAARRLALASPDQTWRPGGVGSTQPAARRGCSLPPPCSAYLPPCLHACLPLCRRPPRWQPLASL